jgi:hypothetical protein
MVKILMGSFATDLLTRENITLAIALWGAVLATYKVISDYRKNVRNIKVEVSYGFVSMGNRVGPNILNIQAINTGYRDVTLNSVGLILNNKGQLIIMDPQGNVQLPHTLEGGKSCIIYKEQSNLSQQLKKNGLSGEVTIKGFYTSATGKVYKSKSIKFNTEKVE